MTNLIWDLTENNHNNDHTNDHLLYELNDLDDLVVGIETIIENINDEIQKIYEKIDEIKRQL